MPQLHREITNADLDDACEALRRWPRGSAADDSIVREIWGISGSYVFDSNLYRIPQRFRQAFLDELATLKDYRFRAPRR